AGVELSVLTAAGALPLVLVRTSARTLEWQVGGGALGAAVLALPLWASSETGDVAGLCGTLVLGGVWLGLATAESDRVQLGPNLPERPPLPPRALVALSAGLLLGAGALGLSASSRAAQALGRDADAQVTERALLEIQAAQRAHHAARGTYAPTL